MRRQHRATFEVAGVARHARSLRSPTGERLANLGQRREIGIVQHEADVRMCDQLAVASTT